MIDTIYHWGVDLRHLTYLVALAREEHFGRAARACHVSQPTLSSGIRRLEGEVGMPLVRRSQRYEGLTPEGERVLDWARRILADVDGLDDELTAIRGGLSGQLRIGAIPTSLPGLSLLTTPLCGTHPGITVAVQSLNSRQIERGLHDFELDLGVTYLDSETLTGVRTLKLYEERYVLLTAEGEQLAAGDDVRWADAATLPLCLLTGDMQNRRIVDGIFHEAGAEPRPTVETNSISTLFAHVRDGPWSSVMAHAWLHLFAVPPGMKALPLYREQYVLLTHADGPLGDRRDVTWAEAAAVPLCLLTRDMQNRRILDGIFRDAGAEARPTVETNSIEALISHVRDGPWSSVMAGAWLHGADLPPGMTAIPLVKPAAIRTVGLVWPDREPEPILARALLEIARRLDVERALRR
jgi:DNA-binding transcriptional LysR family regulator